METFSFKDRPDDQRLTASIGEVAGETTPETVELFFAIQWSYREMQRTYDHLLSRYGLSESKFILLMFLKQAPNEELTPSELAEKLGATRATTTKLLNAMAATGWVEKLPDPKDRRGTIIKLHNEGKEVLATFLPENFRSVAAFLENFTASERQQFNYLLNKLTANVTKFKQEMESSQ